MLIVVAIAQSLQNEVDCIDANDVFRFCHCATHGVVNWQQNKAGGDVLRNTCTI